MSKATATEDTAWFIGFQEISEFHAGGRLTAHDVMELLRSKTAEGFFQRGDRVRIFPGEWLTPEMAKKNNKAADRELYGSCWISNSDYLRFCSELGIPPKPSPEEWRSKPKRKAVQSTLLEKFRQEQRQDRSSGALLSLRELADFVVNEDTKVDAAKKEEAARNVLDRILSKASADHPPFDRPGHLRRPNPDWPAPPDEAAEWPPRFLTVTSDQLKAWINDQKRNYGQSGTGARATVVEWVITDCWVPTDVAVAVAKAYGVVLPESWLPETAVASDTESPAEFARTATAAPKKRMTQKSAFEFVKDYIEKTTPKHSLRGAEEAAKKAGFAGERPLIRNAYRKICGPGSPGRPPKTDRRNAPK